MTPIFSAIISKGKIVIDKLGLFNDYLYTLEGKQVDVTIQKHRRLRTNPQNNWYWACVVGLTAEHFGYEPEEMHTAFKLMFLRKHEEGKPETVKSTTQLSTIEFSEYIEKCRQFASEEGVYIPDPKEVLLPNAPKEASPTITKEMLEELLSWADKPPMTKERIIELSISNFHKEPKDLTQAEAEALDSLIVAELMP